MLSEMAQKHLQHQQCILHNACITLCQLGEYIKSNVTRQKVLQSFDAVGWAIGRASRLSKSCSKKFPTEFTFRDY